MSIYISGVEMPLAGTCKSITIFDNGIVVKAHSSETLGKAIPVPEHGRLGDLDELEKLFLNAGENHKGIGGLMTGMAALCVREMPTIIPASGGKEDERK